MTTGNIERRISNLEAQTIKSNDRVTVIEFWSIGPVQTDSGMKQGERTHAFTRVVNGNEFLRKDYGSEKAFHAAVNQNHFDLYGAVTE